MDFIFSRTQEYLITMKKQLIILSLLFTFLNLSARRAYQKKSAFSGFGKISKITKIPKTKIASGHCKKTCKGYTYVNPYARSK